MTTTSSAKLSLVKNEVPICDGPGCDNAASYGDPDCFRVVPLSCAGQAGGLFCSFKCLVTWALAQPINWNGREPWRL